MKRKEKMERLERELFILEMKDRWTIEDYNEITRLRNEIKELKSGSK